MNIKTLFGIFVCLLFSSIIKAQKNYNMMGGKPNAVKAFKHTMPQTDDVLTLYGMNISTMGGHRPGVYAMTATDPIRYTQVFDSQELKATGGDYANGHAYFDQEKRRMYFCHWEAWVGASCDYYVYDTENWTPVFHDVAYNNLAPAALAITKDPTTGVIYGIFMQEGSLQNFDLGTIVYYDDRRPTINIIKRNIGFFRTLACDNDGQLYGIRAGYSGENNSHLCKIDKETGDISEVGPTDVPVSSTVGNDQSMAFDPNTNELYWAARTTYNGYLFKVDTSTAMTSVVSEMAEHGDVIVGLHIPSRPKADAPADITNLKCQFDEGSNNGSIVFSLPKKSYGGNALTSTLSYTITNHLKVIATGEAEPGDNIRQDVTLDAGMANIEVYASNEAGRSHIAQKKFWVGQDAPRKVDDLQFAVSADNRARLTWTAPTTGIHDGYIHTDNLTYQVIRHPGKHLVAQKLRDTAFEETLPAGQTTGYFYEVVPCNGDIEGEASMSNHQYIGNPYEAPFSEDLKTEESWMKFEAVDANHDGNTWKWNDETGKAFYSTITPLNTDDWLLTPPIHLSPDYIYDISFTANASGTYDEKFEVTIGTDADLSSHRVLSTKSQSTNNSVVHDTEVKVSRDGIYRLAIHLTKNSKIMVSKLEVTQKAYLPSPGKVTDIAITPADHGALSAGITFKAPTTTVDGKAISDVPRIEVHRDGHVVAAVDHVAAGQTVTVQDEGEQMEDGMQTYSIVTYDAEGHIGGTAIMTQYIGIDDALPVSHVVVKRHGKDQLQLTWDEVSAVGAHGGYVPVERATYAINNSSFRTIAVVEAGQPRELVIDVPELEEGQEALLFFGVTTTIDGVAGEMAPSNAYLKGTPCTMPVSEPFDRETSPILWWTENNTYDNIYYSETRSSNDDGISIGLIPTNGICDMSLNSWNITAAGTSHPVLSIDYRFEGTDPAQVQIVAVDDQDNEYVLTTLRTPDVPSDSQWHPINIALDPVLHAHVFYLRFHVSYENAFSDAAVFLDNLRLYDSKAHDLACQLKTPASLTTSQTATFDVTVDNHGHQAARNFSINLYANDKLVDTKVSSIDTYAVDVAQLSYTPTPFDTVSVAVYAEIVYPDEQRPDDNRTATVDIPVYPNAQHQITDLAGEQTDEGRVTLSWTSPDTPKDVVESFEDYEPYISDKAGSWTFVNGIDAPSNGGIIGLPIDLTTRAAGLVYDCNDLFGPDDTEFGTYDGDKAAILLGNMKDLAHDGWLISPRLSGEAQTVTFYAHTQYAFELASMEVRYSENSTDTTDFKDVVLTVDEVPSLEDVPTWTAYTFDLPEGARYFAVHDNSVIAAAHGICLDNFTFKAQGETPTGYIVYRNGEEVGRVDAGRHTFSEYNPAGGTYHVVALYGDVMSGLSNAVYIGATTGIHGIDGDSEAQNQHMYDLQGRRLNPSAPHKGIVIQNGKKMVK